MEPRIRPLRATLLAALVTPALATLPVSAQTLSRIPDPCSLLTRADATELMGEAVEPGRSYPTTPWNCVYRARGSDGLLTLTVELGRETDPASTRSGVELAACGAEVKRPVDGLGVRAALYHTPDGRCGEAWTLWVATGVGFRGRTSSRLTRESEGVVHLTVVRYPPGDPEEVEPVLREAAERVLARLGG